MLSDREFTGQHGVICFGRQSFAHGSDRNVLSRKSISAVKNNQLDQWQFLDMQLFCYSIFVGLRKDS